MKIIQVKDYTMAKKKHEFVETRSDDDDKVKGRGGFVTFDRKSNPDNVIAALIKGLAKIGLDIMTVRIHTSKDEKTGKGFVEAFKEDDK